jgi:hypothetical protein
MGCNVVELSYTRPRRGILESDDILAKDRGYADEFIRLFKKNHYPVLKKERELGRILQVTATTPKYHATEDGRWDYRVTLVWKNVGVTNDGFDAQPLIKQLFPDQETFKKEEQRRFEILAGHWDAPVVDVGLGK